MKDAKYFADGFQTIGEKNKHVKEIDDLINNNNSLEDLEKKLVEISNLADIDKKDETQQSIKSWLFIIVSIVSIYLSVYTSVYWCFLSVPASIFAIAIILMKYVKHPMYLFFKFDSGMLGYLNGTKLKDIDEPYLSYIYMEKRLQIRIKQIQDS